MLTGLHHPGFVFLRKEVFMVPSVWQNFILLTLFNIKDPPQTFREPLSIKFYLLELIQWWVTAVLVLAGQS